MDGATRAELDRLRLRAYGPGGDIDADAGAIGRLVELELATGEVLSRYDNTQGEDGGVY